MTRKALVVEDEQDLGMILAEHLKNWGYEPTLLAEGMKFVVVNGAFAITSKRCAHEASSAHKSAWLAASVCLVLRLGRNARRTP